MIHLQICRFAMLYVTKQRKFSSAHRLFNPTFDEKKNDEIYDKCNNYYGHGHNYTLEVTVAGKPDPKTGYVIDLKVLKRVIDENITNKVDHKHLNFDVPFLEGIIPTVENLLVVFWGILEDKLPAGKLHRIRLYETDMSFVDYYGEPVEVTNFNNS